MAKGDMRDSMPVTAAWIDDLRAAFGTESINRMLRRGMNGEPVFWASENGHTVGTPMPAPAQGRTNDTGVETNRERHYREAAERARNMAAPAVHTSAPGKGDKI
ncbi:MAG: hypothetical protein V4463_05300 [Pseudomonadota bacterium]